VAKRGIKKKKRRKGPKGLRMGPLMLSEEAEQYGIKVSKDVPPGEKYLTPNQAGKILNVTGECVKQWIYHRHIKATKLSNGYWMVKVQDLTDYIKARQNLGHKKIMIVDTAENKEAAQAVEELGHEPVTAINKSDALLKAADLYPAMFIINLSANEFDPWKLAQRIRKTRNIRTAAMLLISDKDLSCA